METCFNYVRKEQGFFSSDEQKWINKIHKLKTEYPEEVEIIREPENNDGCIYCTLPVSWLKIQPKRKSYMTEEQKDALRERLAQARQARSESQ